ncbi:MAG: hypothetical protein M1456_01665 [Actinobacteria bacterium]|nr:hypothetical protein [Actinomycetota bacterium]
MTTSEAERVRKWREKVKKKQLETEEELAQLRTENAELRERERYGQGEMIGWDASDPTAMSRVVATIRHDLDTLARLHNAILECLYSPDDPDEAELLAWLRAPFVPPPDEDEDDARSEPEDDTADVVTTKSDNSPPAEPDKLAITSGASVDTDAAFLLSQADPSVPFVSLDNLPPDERKQRIIRVLEVAESTPEVQAELLMADPDLAREVADFEAVTGQEVAPISAIHLTR